MKKVIKLILSILIISFTTLHAKDSQRINSEKIQIIATKEVKRLVAEKKVAKSWKSIPVFHIGRTTSSYIDDWVVVFENVKIKKKSRRRLYIFITKKGNITGANYTGK